MRNLFLLEGALANVRNARRNLADFVGAAGRTRDEVVICDCLCDRAESLLVVEKYLDDLIRREKK